jgi:hypothetical protein
MTESGTKGSFDSKADFYGAKFKNYEPCQLACLCSCR